MKSMSLVALIVVIIGGRDLGNTVSDENGNLNATFTLDDTTGHSATTFHFGEPLLMSFSLINTRMDTITYYFDNCRPSVIFEILKNDTLVAITPAGC